MRWALLIVALCASVPAMAFWHGVYNNGSCSHRLAFNQSCNSQYINTIVNF